ncbi:MAG: MBL fold metallo-hydrolase [Candidatus Bathyarchaeota archaeon]|nr:MBL fold metallo-hydrolase [Candidatus Bathyarchaeota archaeon]
MVANKTKVTFYGGVNEIGGNKILLQDESTKIFLDFGMSFTAKKQFYSPPFLAPKNERSLQELGILPKIEGVYKFEQTSPDVSAVFLSHGHLDHSAYLSFIKREIPVYCGETTQTILRTLSGIRRADLEFNVSDINFHSFRTGDRIKVDDIVIEPFHVDHSVPGAYGFLVHTSNGTVVYTGDFRDHGAKPEMSWDFVEKARETEPIAVITEATNMTGATVSNEVEVEAKLDKITSQVEGIMLAEFGYSDVDRLNTFYKIAKKNNRCLAVSLKQALLIDALSHDKHLSVPALDDEGLLIFRKSKKRYERWETQLIERFDGGNKIFDVFEVSKQQCRMILAVSFYDLEELVSIQPASGSCYVLSASEPFNEEMELDYERLVNWLSHYGLPQYHVHVSGHMMPLQLKAALRRMGTKRIFPIHTDNAVLFKKFMGDSGGVVSLVEKGVTYEL